MDSQLILTGVDLAPITWSVGFLNLPCEEAGDALASWRRRNLEPGEELTVTALDLGWPEAASRLAPLTTIRYPRELVVQTADPAWSAYLTCSANGTDAVSAMSYLAGAEKVHALSIACIQDQSRSGGPWGAVQFELYGPIETDFMNYVRTIGVVNDEGRWRFDTGGTPQAFEEPEQYTARLVRNRFTPEMLDRYCREFGLRVFDTDFFDTGTAVLHEQSFPVPPGESVLSLDEARIRAGLAPLSR